MPARILREAQRQAARRAVRVLGLRPRAVQAQVRRWGRRGPPISLQAAYWRAIRGALRARPVPSDAELRTLVQPHGLALVRWNRRKYDTPLGRALGLVADAPTLRTDALDPDLESQVLESWTRENVALIKNITVEQRERVTAAVLRAERAGTRAADLQREIASIVAGGVRRARVIARDQIGKFNGQLDRLKQTDAGIDAYIWRTSGDERVRSSHRALNGRRFTWVKAPPEGHPGQPVQCRCQPEPDLSDLLGPEFGAPSAPPRTQVARTNTKRPTAGRPRR